MSFIDVLLPIGNLHGFDERKEEKVAGVAIGPVRGGKTGRLT